MATGLLGDISALSNPFGLPAAGQWNISRGVFTNSNGGQIVFFAEVKANDIAGQTTAVDQIADSGGRRLAVYEYPYIDGQRVDDLGRKGETYTFNIKFFGLNYQSKFSDFVRLVVNTKGQGQLLHPVYSAVREIGRAHV